MSEELSSEKASRALAEDPEVRRVVARATGPILSVTASPEGVEGPHVPTPEEWLQGVRDALQVDAELIHPQVLSISELMRKRGAGA